MSESAIRTAIYNAVDGVSNSGVVYDYERWAGDWSAFLDLFKTTISSTDQIRGWEVGYRGFVADEPSDFVPGHLRIHRYLVTGVLGLDDSAGTEKTMSTLAETVANTIKDDATLDGLSFYQIRPIMLFEPRSFGGVLCHFVEITVEIAEFIT